MGGVRLFHPPHSARDVLTVFQLRFESAMPELHSAHSRIFSSSSTPRYRDHFTAEIARQATTLRGEQSMASKVLNEQKLLSSALLVSTVALAQPCFAEDDIVPLVFSCNAENDLYCTAVACGVACVRADTPVEAVEMAGDSGGVLLLADNYPTKRMEVTPAVLNAASRKKLRLYVEYPASLPGLNVGKPTGSRFERAVIASDFFLSGMEEFRIMQLCAMRYVTIDASEPHVVAARVAGFDTAVYGLPTKTSPLLFHLSPNTLVSTTGFSHFIRARFAPEDALQAFWQSVLSWLANRQVQPLRWQPVAGVSFGPEDDLPQDVQRQAVLRGVAWYDKAGMITGPAPGDGSKGIREGLRSRFKPDGAQQVSNVIRGDCVCESAMTLALCTKLGADSRYAEVARRALDYYLFESVVRKGERADPGHGAYGLIASGEGGWLVANYGDGNAKIMISTLTTAALLGTDRWDEAIMMCLLGNLRTTGQHGFRGGRIDLPALANGYRQYFDSTRINPHPHYEAYLWACFLWAYEQTGYKLFLDRPKTAIQITMERFPNRIPWTNGLAQEKSRILLPLAWLVRVEDTPENRKLLDRAIDELAKLQEPCGAIREEIGDLQYGRYPPPRANEDYGKHEASLIAENGNPVADLLYATNFAFLGLHEAASATDDKRIMAMADRLADFLCRIQIRSETVSQLDGGWFRAFDYKRWEAWASNADAGWGAWCIEAGWTQSWIVSVLAMREMGTSLWDLTHGSKIEKHLHRLRKEMLPDDTPRGPQLLRHAAWNKPVTLSFDADPRYPGNPGTLTDGVLGTPEKCDRKWLGFEGKDVTVTVDLEELVALRTVSVRFLQQTNIGIYPPREVEFCVSTDGEMFHTVGTAAPTDTTGEKNGSVHTLAANTLHVSARYLRVKIFNFGPLPKGRLLRNGRRAESEKPSWIFIDEVLVDGQKG